MLLTVLCALLGAYLGMTGRNPITAGLLATVIASVAHYALVYAMAFLVAFAPNAAVARQLLSNIGVTGPDLVTVVQAAGGAALLAAVLLRILSPPERPVHAV